MGAGRSGLAARAFAMRLMHLGFDVHVVGDVTTPVPTKEDLVIIVSGSGMTRSIVDLGTDIKGKGPKMAIITTNKDYSIILDIAIIIPVTIEDIDRDLRECFLPMGTLFEAVSHIFLDAIISELKYRTRTMETKMKDRHMLSEYVGIL
jgi:6-phospho-3-hexuloisomerase